MRQRQCRPLPIHQLPLSYDHVPPCGRHCELLRADTQMTWCRFTTTWMRGGLSTGYQTGATGPERRCAHARLEVVERKARWLSPECLTTKNSKLALGSLTFPFFLLPHWLLRSPRSSKPSDAERVQGVRSTGSLPWGVAASKVQRPMAYKIKFAFQLFLHYPLAAPEI